MTIHKRMAQSLSYVLNANNHLKNVHIISLYDAESFNGPRKGTHDFQLNDPEFKPYNTLCQVSKKILLTNAQLMYNPHQKMLQKSIDNL